MSSFQHNRAIVKLATGHASISDVAVPKVREGYMLVKTAAVALNPADWTDVDYNGGYEGCVVGLDYAGTVVDPGHGNTRFKQGDRVCGCAHGCNQTVKDDGAFAEYIVVKSDLQMQIPDGMGWEDAATLGVGVLTVGMGMFQCLGLPLPVVKKDNGKKISGKDMWVLVYGGSSATGSLAIQFAKLSGYKVITTCSKRNFDMVKKRGADVVLDYRDPKCASQIQAATSNSLLYILDTIATTETAAICANAVATLHSIPVTGTPPTAIYACTLEPPLPELPDRVPITNMPFLGYMTWGEDFWFEGVNFAANSKDYEFGVGFYKLTEKLLAQGKIITHPAKVGRGLESVLGGMDELRRGDISGVKLVYMI